MPADFDGSELRARVTHDFAVFASHITHTEAMNGFFDAVMTNAVGTIRELLHGFNEASSLARIPPEILAACFANLPFRYRLSPTHVCRSWRAAALSAPELWSNISPWSPSNSPEFIRMALSRAGALPVYLKLNSRRPGVPEAMFSAIAPFSRQIRYLTWHSEHPDSPWEFPAPNMEWFCTSRTITITNRFLGGHEGRLRYLYLQAAYLPETCPVFSTVTDLNIVLTPVEEDVPPSTLTNLFELFPRLEWLQMLSITHIHAHLLPTGPAPATLRELWLDSRSWEYDLTLLYVAWDSGNLQHASLSQYPGIHPNLERMSRGTVRIAVKYGNDESEARFMFEHSATVSHSVAISQFTIADTVSVLAAVQSNLSTVQTAMISHVALQPLLDLLTGLPNLEHLFVHIVPKTADGNTYPNPDPHSFVWTHLACLPDLVRGIPRLREITLHVWCGGCRKPTLANTDDARALISQLRVFGGTLPPVEIQGFRAEDVADIDVAGLNVRFDFATQVGELQFHEQSETWDPCW